MAGSHNEASSFGFEPRYTLTIVEPDGRTTDIGEAFLYCQCGRGRYLSAQAKWSPDSWAVVFRDWGIPEQAEPGHDAGEFWLYRIDTGQRVDLFAEDARWLSTRGPAVFHPDGQSLYVRRSSRGGKGDDMLLRITLDGDDWPGFKPIPAVADVRVSPNGKWLIAMTNGALLTFTDQGELQSARTGARARWLPDSRHYVYLNDGLTMIGHIGSDRPEVVHLPELSPWVYHQLSPDGEHIAVEVPPVKWPYYGWDDTREIRIYARDGRLRTTFRYTGCSQWHWSPDGSRLAVSARSDCSAP